MSEASLSTSLLELLVNDLRKCFEAMQIIVFNEKKADSTTSPQSGGRGGEGSSVKVRTNFNNSCQLVLLPQEGGKGGKGGGGEGEIARLPICHRLCPQNAILNFRNLTIRKSFISFSKDQMGLKY